MQFVELTHSQYSIHALDFIFARPIVKSSHFTKNNDIPTPTAKRIINVLREHDLLLTLRPASGRRSAIYAFPELINTAEGHDVF